MSSARLESAAPMPLIIAQRAPVGQPIQFFAGAGGLIRAMEIDGAGTTWVRGPLSVGNGIGATNREVVRIGSVLPINGDALVISMTGTTTSTGLLIHDVGASGSEDAGLVIRSVANGLGTGIRIGGPSGGERPSLGSGIDITGGTGLRYNALTTGNGTAIDIGGTTPPRRGIEVITSGTAHIGILSTANTNGVGIVGVSQSSSYSGSPLSERIGVRGHSASNSTVASDTITGSMGSAIRGGNGGTLTTSIGTFGRADASGVAHAGTAIGVLGRANAIAPGRAIAFGGCFISEMSQMSLVALGGDVFLGSSTEARPVQISLSTAGAFDTRTLTHVYDVNASGLVQVSMLALPNYDKKVLGAGLINDLNIGPTTVLRIAANVAITTLTGCADERDGRVIVVLVTEGILNIQHEGAGSQPEHRFLLRNATDITLDENTAITIWYDTDVTRWRILSTR